MENTKISWTTHTFNPWQGCTRVSPGCQRCYAETMMDKRFGKVKWGPAGERMRTSKEYWEKPEVWNRKAEKTGERPRVFCASTADVFEDNPQLVEWQKDLFALIERTPHIDWLLLTKRANKILSLSPAAWRVNFPLNVWMGVSVEDQQRADERIPYLMRVPAVVKFVSIEPLLGPIDLWGARYANPAGGLTGALTSWGNGIDWGIVGGESGQGARPMNVKWAQDIRRDFKEAEVPFFMKQLGGCPDKRHELTDFPEDLRVREFPNV